MRFRAIPQIPKGVLDPQLTRVLEALKENFEILSGQRGDKVLPLPTGASLDEVVAKVNDLVSRSSG